MDYLQYIMDYVNQQHIALFSFKPCYKWITFNITYTDDSGYNIAPLQSFKPCYKWITFNIELMII